MQAILSTEKEFLTDKIRSHTAKVGIKGLGYLGLPLAMEFANAGFPVTGIDVQPSRVEELNNGRSYILASPPAPCARLSIPADFAPPKISPSSLTWIRSISPSRPLCARPRTRT